MQKSTCAVARSGGLEALVGGCDGLLPAGDRSHRGSIRSRRITRTADLETAGGTGSERLDARLFRRGGKQLLGFRHGETGFSGENQCLRHPALSRGCVDDGADTTAFVRPGSSDGRVAVEEITGKQNLAFKLLDRNGDCQIDRTESVQVHGIDKGPAKSSAPDTTQTGPDRGTSGRPGGY